jgi:hypothetical protein
MYERLKGYLPKPTYFCGVDRDPMYLMKYAIGDIDTPGYASGVPFRLVYGPFNATCIAALKEQRGSTGPKIGVLNFDTMESALPAWWSKQLRDLHEIRDLGMEGCPAFTMIFNHVLNMGGGVKAGDVRNRIRQHGKALLQTLGAWIPLRDHGLFVDIADRYDHARLPMQLGAYDIYRSKNEKDKDNVAVMITVRLTFKAGQKRILFDKAT